MVKDRSWWHSQCRQLLGPAVVGVVVAVAHREPLLPAVLLLRAVLAAAAGFEDSNRNKFGDGPLFLVVQK